MEMEDLPIGGVNGGMKGKCIQRRNKLTGRYVEYMVSGIDSPEALVFYISGIGLDCSDFEKHLEDYQNCTPSDLPMSGARHYALTIPGFEDTKQFKDKDIGDKPDISEQAKLIMETMKFFNKKYSENQQMRIILYGFSYGADLIINMLYSENHEELFLDRVILTDFNGSPASTFITSKLMNLDVSQESNQYDFLVDLIKSTLDDDGIESTEADQNKTKGSSQQDNPPLKISQVQGRKIAKVVYDRMVKNILNYTHKIVHKDGLQIKKNSKDAVVGAKENLKKLCTVVNKCIQKEDGTNTVFQIYLTNAANYNDIDKYFQECELPEGKIKIVSLINREKEFKNSPVIDHFWFTTPYGIQKLLSNASYDVREKPIRILSLDGGGLRGIYTAMILKHIQDEKKIVFSEYFDIIAGTSTGAILAAALATDEPLDKIIDLYGEKGKFVFSSIWPRKINLGLFFSKYSQDPLEIALQDIFKKKTMKSAKCKLMIFTTDIANGIPRIIRSYSIKGNTTDSEIKISDALLASTAAPIFFNPKELGDELLADGGIWCNNPSLCAITEAEQYLDQDLRNIHLLSIGTIHGNKTYKMSRSQHPIIGRIWGFIGAWRAGLFDLILNLQSLLGHNTVNQFRLGDYLGNYVRINSEVDTSLPLDDPKTTVDYKTKAHRTLKEQSNLEKIDNFFDQQA